MKFKVGDQVRVINAKPFDMTFAGVANGDTGTIKGFYNGVYLVEFEKKYNYPIHEIQLEFAEPENNETIVIYREGAEVVALDRSTGIKTQITFRPADIHNFHICAKEVFLQLIKKIQAVENSEPIKEGDTVEVINKMKTYSAYDYWEGLREYESHFVVNRTPDEGKYYKVLRVLKHGGTFNPNELLALIQDPLTTQVFIIGIEGLRKVEEVEPWES